MAKANGSSGNGKGRHVCPECGKTYDAANALGRHRQMAHQVAGTSASAVAIQKKKQAEQSKKTNLTGSYKKRAVMPAKTSISAEPPSAKVMEKVVVFPISTEMVAYAAGKAEFLIEQIARDNGLPVVEFVARTAECLVAVGKSR